MLDPSEGMAPPVPSGGIEQTSTSKLYEEITGNSSFSLQADVAHMQGRRPRMEDRHVLSDDLIRSVLMQRKPFLSPTALESSCDQWKHKLGCYPVSFYGLFDGHQGSLASEWCAANLAKQILTEVVRSAKETFEAKDERPSVGTGEGSAETEASALPSPRERQVEINSGLPQGSTSSKSPIECPLSQKLQPDAVREAIKCAFLKVDNSFIVKHRLNKDGCTAVTILFLGEDIYVAGLGDSRAILGALGFWKCENWSVCPSVVNGRHKQPPVDDEIDASVKKTTNDNNKDMRVLACRLTQDHKPDLPAEKERIQKNGGSVVHLGGVARVAPADYENRVKRIKMSTCTVGGSSERTPVLLAVSRAIGDRYLKETGSKLLSSTPDITHIRLDPVNHRFLCVACDGVWDVLTDQEAADIVAQYPGDSGRASKALIKSAYDRGSEDNLTAIVIWFSPRGARAEEAKIEVPPEQCEFSS